MKQKRVLVLFLIFLIIGLIALFHAAETSEETDSEKAYTCLKNAINENNCTQNNIPVIAFNLMAGAYDRDLQTKCKNALLSKKTSNECWPEREGGSCDLKSTSLAILSLLRIGEGAEKSINWTLSKKILEDTLIWYLEVETPNSSVCQINGNTVTIGADKKIISGAPAGLERTYNNYWFKIKDIKKNYTISCDKSLTTTLMYQKPSSNVYYVSSNPHTAAAGDSTVEKVESYCFGTGSTCNYESSLWTVLALLRDKRDISQYLPYIYSMSEDSANLKYLPSAFLLMFTGMSEYEIDLKANQKEGKFWGERSTALELSPLAISALLEGNSGDSTEVTTSKKYLLGLQDKTTGCWQEDKTSYILYMVWPKTPLIYSPSNPVNPITTCEDMTYSCVSSTRCETKDIESYSCSIGICCSNPIEENTCEEQGGKVCLENEECSESTIKDSDNKECCLAECTEKTPELDPCSGEGYTCRNTCNKDESERSTKQCTGNLKCCYKEQTKSNKLWLIILLIILIILVILAIIFRNQLQVWWFRIKSRFSSKKGPPPSSRPVQPSPMFRPVPQRPMIPRQENRMLSRPLIRRPGEKDKDFEDTMKKLRDMSK